MKLNNGITALIISDPSPIIESKEEDDHQNEIVDDDEDDDGSDSGSDDEEESNSDAPKEKLAACSLCIDVGYVDDHLRTLILERNFI